MALPPAPRPLRPYLTVLATGSEDGVVRLWEYISNVVVVLAPSVRAPPIRSISFANDGNLMVVVSSNRRQWDVKVPKLFLLCAPAFFGVSVVYVRYVVCVCVCGCVCVCVWMCVCVMILLSVA